MCCTLRVENSAISCSLVRTAVTQVQCAVKLGKEWGIRGLRSKQKFSNKAHRVFKSIYLCLIGNCCQELKVSESLDAAHKRLCIFYFFIVQWVVCHKF